MIYKEVNKDMQHPKMPSIIFDNNGKMLLILKRVFHHSFIYISASFFIVVSTQ